MTTDDRTTQPEPADPGAEAAPPLVTLLDGARAAGALSPAEFGAEHGVAADPDRPLAERLEAFEDLTDSEVGDTSLSRARNLEREFGIRQLFLKFDGGNPSGTQKDRIAFAQVADALRRGFESITVATCGNYGAAVAVAAALVRLPCVIFIPTGFHTRRVGEMTACGARIERVEGDYESSVAASRLYAEGHEAYDANPGGANTPIQLQAYGEIAFEIYDELRDAPAVVAVPVSNGTTLAGIYKGFVRLYRRGKTSRIPRLVAGSSSGKNPIVSSFMKGLDRCQDLDPAKLRETPVNEPLINWHSADGDHALEAIRLSGGWAGNASDRVMLRHSRVLRDKEGLNVLPASSAGLAVLLERHQREPFPGDRYVVVLTGRK